MNENNADLPKIYVVCTPRGACLLREDHVKRIRGNPDILKKTLLILTLVGVNFQVDYGDIPLVKDWEEFEKYYLPHGPAGGRSILA